MAQLEPKFNYEKSKIGNESTNASKKNIKRFPFVRKGSKHRSNDIPLTRERKKKDKTRKIRRRENLLIEKDPGATSKIMDRKVLSNTRLLTPVQQVINKIDGNQQKMGYFEETDSVDDHRMIDIPRNQPKEVLPKRPVFRNPHIEKALNISMKNVLKKYKIDGGPYAKKIGTPVTCI